MDLFTFQTYAFYFVIMGFRDLANLMAANKIAPAKTDEDKVALGLAIIILPFFTLFLAWAFPEIAVFALNNSFLHGHEISTNTFRLAYPLLLVAANTVRGK